MSYTGTVLHVGNKDVDALIKDLEKLKKKHKGKKIKIGYRVCNNECDSWGTEYECNCDTYSVEIE